MKQQDLIDPGLLAKAWEQWQHLRPVDLIAGRRNPEQYDRKPGSRTSGTVHRYTDKRSTRA